MRMPDGDFANLRKMSLAARSTTSAQNGGALRLIPDGASLVALEKDYAAMREAGLLAVNPITFAEFMEHCACI
jgi:hypothetical protein